MLSCFLLEFEYKVTNFAVAVGNSPYTGGDFPLLAYFMLSNRLITYKTNDTAAPPAIDVPNQPVYDIL